MFAKLLSVSNHAGIKYLAIIFAFMTTSVAAAEGTFFFDKNLTLEDLRELEVRVYLQDNATGACWTNLKEVREYAEEKFRSKGIKTSDTEFMDVSSKHYWLSISVGASRMYKNNEGWCVGSVDIKLMAWSVANGAKHLSILGLYSGQSGIQINNFNKFALLVLEQVFSEFPKD